MGSLEPLRGYQGEDIEIQLPGNLTVYDIDWLAVWCVAYQHNFGHVFIPDDLDVPPALGQTKITVIGFNPNLNNTPRNKFMTNTIVDPLKYDTPLSLMASIRSFETEIT